MLTFCLSKSKTAFENLLFNQIIVNYLKMLELRIKVLESEELVLNQKVLNERVLQKELSQRLEMEDYKVIEPEGFYRFTMHKSNSVPNCLANQKMFFVLQCIKGGEIFYALYNHVLNLLHIAQTGPAKEVCTLELSSKRLTINR